MYVGTRVVQPGRSGLSCGASLPPTLCDSAGEDEVKYLISRCVSARRASELGTDKGRFVVQRVRSTVIRASG
jgi:hypothetical protein